MSRARVIGLGLAVAGAVLQWPGAAVADWPQWRGGKVDGIAADAQWPANPSALAVAWTADLGVGYSAATVVDGKVYTAGWANDQDTVWCLDAATGRPVWSRSYPMARHNNMHEGGPAATPAVAGGRVFMISRDGDLFALSAADGKPLWSKALARELRVREPEWAFSGSPVLDGDALLVDVGRVLALEPASGKAVWASEDFGAAYSTPVAFDFQGKRYVAAFPKLGLVILDRATGKTVATHPWKTDYGVNAPTPIIQGDRIFITSGYNSGGALLRFTGAALQLLWENKELGSQMATPVVVGEHLYGFDEGTLKCVALADGTRAWAQRGLGKGALAVAGDTLVIQGEDGALVLAAAQPAGFRELARTQAFRGQRSWVMPVPVGNRVYCRSPAGTLAAVDVK